MIPYYKKISYSIFVLSLLSFFFIILFRNGNVRSLPVGWDKTYQITPFDIYVKNIRLAQKGNIIAVVYEGEKNKTSGIYVTLSFNAGLKFLDPVKVASISSKTDRNPDIAVSSNGHIALVWQELSEEDPNSRIYYSISGDMGASWSEPFRLKSDTEMELLPRVLYDEKNTLHVFYNAYKDKGFNLFHISSTDEKIFSESKSIIEISEGLRGAFFPAIHASGNYIYLIWQGKEKVVETLSDDLYLIESRNYGKTWSTKKLLTKSKAKDSSPFIIPNNNNIYLVYQNNDTKNWAIKLMRGTERGSKWEDPITVSSTNADCYSPVAALSDDGNLFVIWYDMRNKTPGIFARKIPLQGQSTAQEVMLSRTNISARKPLAVSAGRKIIVMWEESGRVMIKNTDVIVDSPIVYSPTNPENVWSRTSKALIRWKSPADESGIAGYAYSLKRPEDVNIQDIDPTIVNIQGNITEFITPELSDGISTFYIKAFDGAGNYSRTVSYRLMVSKNPPQMPIVRSSTHDDGKPAESKTALLSWNIEDPTRIKGFLYSISKDNIRNPDIFTTDLTAKFENLSDGRHFFAIRSVDKTNQLSRIATYQIIVNEAEKMDPELLKRIALGETVIEKKQIKQVVKVKIPSIELIIPFDEKEFYNQTMFTAEIKTNDIEKKEILGYSYFLGKEEKWPPDRINSRDSSILIDNLEDGEYYLSAKCMYSHYKNNVKEYLWTEPVVKRFTIRIKEEYTAVAFLRGITDRLTGNYIALYMSVSAMVFSLLTAGFGAKISFYAKLFLVRISGIFKISQ